jgi:hypothetical protein
MRWTLLSARASRRSSTSSSSAKGASASATTAPAWRPRRSSGSSTTPFRTSSNSAYVSPTRGQQGNALQTLLAMAHALTGKPGLTVIESRGVRHQITFDIDPISREPRLDHQRVSIPAAPGMKVTMFWGASLDEEQQIGLSNAAVDLSSTRTRT